MIKKIKNLKYELIPLIFGIFIVISFMHNYDDNLTLLFLIISVIIQGAIYIFYNFISKKGKVLQYVSILGSFSILGIATIILINSSGDALDFFIWFISTQDVVEYSSSYIFILLIGLNVFIASTVFYFTQIKYRLFVTFLLMLIPFSIFAKENDVMPIRFLLPLIVLYFAMLITCGQNILYSNEKVKTIQNMSYIKSIGSFILSFILVISLIPKPQIRTNREVFENLITANTLTDFLLSQLSGFTDTSNGNGFAFNSSKKLYSVTSSETLAVKSRTFSSYDFNNNVWGRTDNTNAIDNVTIDTNLYFDDKIYSLSSYDRYGIGLEDNTIDKFKQELNPTKLLNAIVYSISKDSEFANKYNLQNVPQDITFQDCTKSFTVKSTAFMSSFVLNPTNTYKITDVKNDYNILSSTYSGIILPLDEERFISSKAEYSMDYYSKSLMDQHYVRDILSNLSFENYGTFLNRLSQITKGTDFENVIDAYIQDYDNTATYSTVFTDCGSEKILNLAEDITKDCNSDIEKAEALESYFIMNGFNYDANFQLKNDENIEDFIFRYKTGACYEYSTSFILMARAIGLPARYVEGFLIDNPNNEEIQMDLTAGSSHAYPEVYISGFGWCYFEPTQSYTLSQDIEGLTFSQNTILIITSVSICSLGLITYLFIILIYPKLYEMYFRKKVLKVSSNDGLSLIINRIKKISSLENSYTLEEIQKLILETYKIDIQNIIDVANQTFYSDLTVTSDIVKKSLEEYVYLYNTIKESKKSKVK